MFKRPFSFKGRIRRTEFVVSFIAYVVILTFVNSIFTGATAKESNLAAVRVLSLFYFALWIPLTWFLLSQAVKRSHDTNKNGWWIIVPLFPLWLLFARGTYGENEFGNDPR